MPPSSDRAGAIDDETDAFERSIESALIKEIELQGATALLTERADRPLQGGEIQIGEHEVRLRIHVRYERFEATARHAAARAEDEDRACRGHVSQEGYRPGTGLGSRRE